MHQNLTINFSGSLSINAADLEFVYTGDATDYPKFIDGKQYQELDEFEQTQYTIDRELHELLEISEDFKTDVKLEKPYVRYVIVVFGHWGAGETIEEAEKNLKKAGGKKKDKRIVHRFDSFFPFAPNDREANDDEADVYIDSHGTLCFIRCQQEVVDPCSLQSC